LLIAKPSVKGKCAPAIPLSLEIVTGIETIKVEKKTADTEKQKQDQKELSDLAKQNAKEREAAAKEQLRLADALRKKLQENAMATETDPAKKIQMARQFANEDYAMQLERLQNAKATQDEIDLLSAGHTDTIQKLNTEEVKINENKNTQVLAAEKKLQASLLALALAQETDPLKRAQIINDAKEKEIDDKLALVEKGSTDEQALLADKATAEIEAAKRVSAALIEVNKNTNKDITKTEEEAAAERKAIRDGAFQVATFALQAYGESVARQTDEEFGILEDAYDDLADKLAQSTREIDRKEALIKNYRGQLKTISKSFDAPCINAEKLENENHRLRVALDNADTANIRLKEQLAEEKAKQRHPGDVKMGAIIKRAYQELQAAELEKNLTLPRDYSLPKNVWL
jgi:hypothetical protein